MTRRFGVSRVGRPAPSGVLLVALAMVVLVSSCTSYRRALEPEPEPAAPTLAPALEPIPEAEPAPIESASPRPAEPIAESEPAPESRLATVFPGIRIDTAKHLVEFDARISPMIFAPYEGRFFYLEEFVCKAGTKDHESLVVTDVAPSNIHAALLLVGLEPGRPVTWEHPQGEPVALPAEGPAVDVFFVLNEGQGERVVDPREWTKVKKGSRRFPAGHWIFAGSDIAGTAEQPFYEADAAGTIVGLASFGTEVIAWPRVISHEEADEQLEWVADLEAMPEADTPVVVRVKAAK